MKTKCIESEHPPSPLFPADGYLLDHTITKSNGREFKLLGIREKNYKGSLFERLWLGISAFCQAFFAVVIWASVSDTVREDWHTAWTGKRLTAIYYKPLSITPLQVGVEQEALEGQAENDHEQLFSLPVLTSLLPIANSDTSHPLSIADLSDETSDCSHKDDNLDPLDVSDLPFLEQTPAETFDPFSFLKLPVDLQERIFPFLSLQDIARLRTLNKAMRQNVDEYLQPLHVQFERLNELEQAYANEKSEKNKAKIGFCVEAILSHEKWTLFTRLAGVSAEQKLLDGTVADESIASAISEEREVSEEDIGPEPKEAVLVSKAERLHEFLTAHSAQRENFFTILTREGYVPIDWERKDPTIQKVMLDLFLKWAPDAPLAKFIGSEVCHKVGKQQFRYPSFVKHFFENLTDLQVERLANLRSIIEPLLRVMCDIPHSRLLARLYEKQPDARVWDRIRNFDSDYSELICLLDDVWLLDTLALLRTASDADSLVEKLKDLFNTFKMPGRDELMVRNFAWLFLISAHSLNPQQIRAVARALGCAPLFKKHGYDAGFMRAMFSFKLSYLEKQGCSEPDAIIVLLLQEWVSLKAHSTDTSDDYHDSVDFRGLVEDMSRQEHVKAFIEGVKDSPEPWRTLYLSLLIRNKDKIRRHLVSTEDIMEAFSSLGFDYHDYPCLSTSACDEASRTSTRGYLERLRGLDSEEKLVAFLTPHENRKTHYLRALVGGIVFSKTLTLKPRVDEQLIKDRVEKFGHIFEFFNEPISIGEFLAALD